MKFKTFEKVSFRLSEQTSYDLIAKRKLSFSHRHDEVVVLLSQSEDQLIFVSGYVPLDGGARVLSSRRLRLTKGTWDVLKLKEYAELVGLKVDDWSILDRAMRSARQRAMRALKAA
jgi:hypothetical protein